MITELAKIRTTITNPARCEVFCSEDRELNGVPGDISAVITSPPYPNEKDYTRTTRVDSIIVGLLRDCESLRQVKESLLRSNTRNIFVEVQKAEHFCPERRGREFLCVACVPSRPLNPCSSVFIRG
jgi:hypothetical protein